MISKGSASLSFFHLLFCSLPTFLLYQSTVTPNISSYVIRYFFFCGSCLSINNVLFLLFPIHLYFNGRIILFWTITLTLWRSVPPFLLNSNEIPLNLFFRSLFSFVKFSISISFVFVNTFFDYFLYIFILSRFRFRFYIFFHFLTNCMNIFNFFSFAFLPL